MSDFGVAVQDDGYRRALLDPSTLLDTPHHDVPERHEIGKALLAPGIPKGIGLTPSAGISPAPARSDHVHGAFTGSAPRGILAQGATVPEPVACAVGAATVLGSVSFTPLSGRVYRWVFVARAVGPGTSGQNLTFHFRLSGSSTNILANVDHWFAGNTQWHNMHISGLFGGNGLPCFWQIIANSPNVIAHVYPTNWYIEDLGAPN